MTIKRWILCISWRHHWLLFHIFMIMLRRRWKWRRLLMILKSGYGDRRSHRFFLHKLSNFIGLHWKLMLTSPYWLILSTTWLFSTINRPIFLLCNFLILLNNIFLIKLIKIKNKMINFLLILLFLKYQFTSNLSSKFGDISKKDFILCLFLLNLRWKYVMNLCIIFFK